jgi:hypothetical protein
MLSPTKRWMMSLRVDAPPPPALSMLTGTGLPAAVVTRIHAPKPHFVALLIGVDSGACNAEALQVRMGRPLALEARVGLRAAMLVVAAFVDNTSGSVKGPPAPASLASATRNHAATTPDCRIWLARLPLKLPRAPPITLPLRCGPQSRGSC